MPKTEEELRQEIVETKQKINSSDSASEIDRLQEKLGGLARDFQEKTGRARTPSAERQTAEQGFTLPPALSEPQEDKTRDRRDTDPLTGELEVEGTAEFDDGALDFDLTVERQEEDRDGEDKGLGGGLPSSGF